MSAAGPVRPAAPYRTWRTRSVTVGRESFDVATKPGLIGHGTDDPAARMLAEAVRVPVGATVAQLNCGSGLFGTVAVRRHGAAEAWLTDRHVVGVEAAQRTAALNGATTVHVAGGHGALAMPEGLQVDVVAIRVPTEKAALLQLVADAFRLLKVGGTCNVAGATNEGIKSAATLLEQVFGSCTVLATGAGHRVVMAVKRGTQPTVRGALDAAVPAAEFRTLEVPLRGLVLRLASRPGVFSWEHLDEATAILADVMTVQRGDDVLDLGCGTGVLGVLASALSQEGQVVLVDADLEAVRCVQHTIDTQGLSRCTALGSDIAGAVLDRRFDVVVTNPPFHVGKATDLEVPAQFIRDAHAVLKPGGRLQLVANRTLPYEQLLREQFGRFEVLHDGARFKVLGAVRRT